MGLESAFNNRISEGGHFIEGRTSDLKAKGHVGDFEVTYGPGDIFKAEKNSMCKGLEVRKREHV